MTIEEQKLLREERLANNQYQGTDTIGRSMVTGLIANPLIDSAVINSSAKNNADTFLGAIKTGIYRNNTVMGGNTIFGAETFSDNIPFIGKKLKDFRSGLGEGVFGTFFGDKYSFQRVGETAQKHSKATDDFAKIKGVSSGDHILESGYGFSKNYKTFFNEMNNQGIMESSFTYTDEAAYQKSLSNATNNKQTKRVHQRYKEGKYKKTLTFEDSLNEAFETGNSENLKKVLENHFDSKSQATINRTIKGLEDAGVDTSKIITKRMVDKANIVNNAFENLDGKAIQGVFENLSAKQKAEALSQMGIDNLNKINFTDAKSFGEIAESFKKTDLFKTLTKYAGMSTDGLNKELAEAIVGKYVEKTAFEKFMSNKMVQVITGNVAAGALGTVLNIAGAVTGTMASMHAESAINNFSDVMTNYAIKGEHVSNEKAQISSYGHSGLSYSNDQDLYNILASDNMADRYRKDIDPINIDDRGGKLSDFLVY